MIILNQIAFQFDVAPLGEKELRKRALAMFDAWERKAHKVVPLDDYSLQLAVEEGSLKGAAKIAAGLGIVVSCVSNIGGLPSGLRQLSKGAKAANEFLVQVARVNVPRSPEPSAVRRDSAALGRFERIVTRIQAHELTPAEGFELVKVLAKDEQPESVWKELRGLLKEASKTPKQLVLALDEVIGAHDEAMERHRRNSSRTPAPIRSGELFRVEVSRSRKRGRRQIIVKAKR